MAKVVKNLSKIQVNKGGTEYELSLPKTDASGLLENVAYVNTTNSFTESQELVLKATDTYEASELKGKSSKYDRATNTHDSGTNSSLLVTSLVDKNNKIVADSTLQVTSGTASAMFEVPNQDGSTVAQLGIKFNPATNKFDSFAPNTSTNSADNAIVTKKYLEEQLEGYVSSGEAVNVETATNDTKGIVLLSDAPGDADSINGGTAVTPKALKDVVTAYKQADALLRNDLEQQIAQGGGGSLSYIVTPTIINPTQDSTDQSTLINIIGTAFKSVFDDDARISRHFQIASDAEFLTIVKEKEINADSWVIDPPQLADTTKYYVRIKDKATSGYSSSWSPIRTFTTGEGLRPADPVITLKGYNNSPVDIGSGLTIETQAFSVPGGSDTHKATSWSIATKSRANVWESLNDTVNKTSITVPKGTLQKATEYVLTVVFHGTNYGDSNPVTAEFTTSADFGTVNAPTLTVEGEPNSIYETPTLTAGAFSNTREPDTHEMTDWEIVPTAGGEAVWQSLSNTSNKTSIDVPEDILQVSTAYIARVRYKGTNFGWSSWTEKQFTTANVFALVGTPVISGATSDVIDSQQFTASAFSMTVGSGEHDKSDWILVKANAASVEVWSSKNDTVNKTVCPSLAEVLEVSTSYILKVRYHDSINDIWSEYGQLSFTTAEGFASYYDIGIPGTMGFGVGVCEDTEGLATLGLTPMDGTDNPNSENYGNYQHSRGILVFIPAFVWKPVSNPKSPSYFEVKSFKDFNFNEEDANAEGYILPQAFLDGGVPQKGFFFDKYGISKGVKSVKGGVLLNLESSNNSDAASQDEGNGAVGNALDALRLAPLFGTNYNCCSSFQIAVLGMLSLVHGWNATDTASCAWYDPEGITNYPKGCNNGALGDVDDPSIIWTSTDSKIPQKPNAGAVNHFAKTTHNGQMCGITGLNGCMELVTTGVLLNDSYFYTIANTTKFTDFKVDNTNDCNSGLYIKAHELPFGNGYAWGSTQNQFYTDKNGINRAMCGVWSKNPATYGTNEFGKDRCCGHLESGYTAVIRCGGWFRDTTSSNAGIWSRYLQDYTSWTNGVYYWGFRVAAYLPEV